MKKSNLIPKMTALLLAAALTLSGCSLLGNALPEALDGLIPSAEEAAPTVTPAQPTGIKIGVSLWAKDDPLSEGTIALIDRAAAVLGVEVVYAACDYDSRRIRRSVSDFIADGCDGILLAGCRDEDIAAAIRLCDEKGVRLAQFDHWIDETRFPETYALAQASDCYIGAVHGEERTASYKIMNALITAGDRSFGYIAASNADTTEYERYIGYHMATESFLRDNPKADIQFPEPVEAATAEEGYRTVKKMLSEDPALEAVLISGGGGDVLDGALLALSELGLIGVVDVAARDATDNMKALLTSGAVFSAATGSPCQGFYGFLMLQKAINGSYVKEAGTAGFDFTITDMYMDSISTGDNYDDSFLYDVPYTDTEILQLSDISAEALKEHVQGFTLTDVLSRHAKETFRLPSLSDYLRDDEEDEAEKAGEEPLEETDGEKTE